MKKLEIEKTKPTFNISTFKTGMIKVSLVFSISNFFIAKTSLANNWRSFSSSNLALEVQQILPLVPFYYIAGVCNNMKNSLFEVKKKQVQSEWLAYTDCEICF